MILQNHQYRMMPEKMSDLCDVSVPFHDTCLVVIKFSTNYISACYVIAWRMTFFLPKKYRGRAFAPEVPPSLQRRMLSQLGCDMPIV
jgi:hypothetical protein